jgi:hypothetical protein
MNLVLLMCVHEPMVTGASLAPEARVAAENQSCYTHARTRDDPKSTGGGKRLEASVQKHGPVRQAYRSVDL